MDWNQLIFLLFRVYSHPLLNSNSIRTTILYIQSPFHLFYLNLNYSFLIFYWLDLLVEFWIICLFYTFYFDHKMERLKKINFKILKLKFKIKNMSFKIISWIFNQICMGSNLDSINVRIFLSLGFKLRFDKIWIRISYVNKGFIRLQPYCLTKGWISI